MATSVVSGRVDETIKHRADITIRQAGLTSTQVIQNVWESIAETGKLPVEARQRDTSRSKRRALNRLDSFLQKLPPVNQAYANMSDDELLAQRIAANE